ncbi:Ceramide synthase 4 [Galdieria sulphuraria]|uniref:Longevity assurance protein LAG1 n=1 Tax=Galdieria sulphuraria TaxID=130081 RepID=M2Y641_GALSU|nr:longevity assurance protein LAG1 [Galdieria sulphuraria]EME31468.1 longevity assurance protein LAG1 [Galdieria sulphuraria]GJD06621.1 Ceramide synthase 4 [Galdieria sulphuraria]|eukprot:XP_005707988.1 longevity assurance protein LAG1 [Galdieria sulphuraria]
MALKYHKVFDGLREIINIIKQEQVLKEERPVHTLNPFLRSKDFFIVLCITVMAAALRFVLQNKLLPLWFSKFAPSRRRKICENIFYTVFYIFSFWYGVVVITQENWTIDPRDTIIREFWTPFPAPMSTLFRSYYLMEAGYYCGALLFLSFDTRRSDFLEFVIHHGSTVFLVLISYIFGYVRIGLYILCIHDASDILLYLAKVLYYVRWNADIYVFSFFAIVFYLTRLVIYPRIVWSVAVDSLRMVLEKPSFNYWAAHWQFYLLHYFLCLIALIVLQLLHCFWFSLILKMVYRSLSASTEALRQDGGDIRSDDEEEDEKDG